MATIDSLPDRLQLGFATALSLKSDYDGAVLVSRMYPHSLAGATPEKGCVSDRASYVVDLLSKRDLGEQITVAIEVEGSTYTVQSRACEALAGEYPWVYPLTVGDGVKLFKDTVGFAVVKVRIRRERAEPLFVQTARIACACSIEDIRMCAGGMLKLLQGDELAAAVELMTFGAKDGGEGGGEAVRKEASTLEGICAACEEYADEMLSQLNALRARPRTKPSEKLELRRPEQVRRFGREEAERLLRGPICPAGPGHAGNVRANGSRFAVDRVECSVAAKSADVAENRAILSSLANACSSMATLKGMVAEDAERLEAARRGIVEQAQGEESLPSVMLLDAQLAALQALENRVDALSRRCKPALASLERAWGMKARYVWVLPPKTKVFCEVPHYMRAYEAMSRWYDLETVDLQLAARLYDLRSLSGLHELFCLAKLLTWFSSHGFEARTTKRVKARDGAAQRGDGPDVANVFELARGNEEVVIWYQPVFYGDARDPYGCGAHRLTVPASFAVGEGDGTWTPDFALLHKRSDVEDFFVLDAKFTLTEIAKERCYLDKALLKYRTQTGREGGVAGVWLLCGKDVEPCLDEQRLSSWAAHVGGRSSGTATVSAFGDSLDAMMAQMGIEAEGRRFAAASSAVDPPAAKAERSAADRSAAGKSAAEAEELGDVAAASSETDNTAEAQQAVSGEDPDIVCPEGFDEHAFDLLLRLSRIVDIKVMTGMDELISKEFKAPLAVKKLEHAADLADLYTEESFRCARATLHFNKCWTRRRIRKLDGIVRKLEAGFKKKMGFLPQPPSAPGRDGSSTKEPPAQAAGACLTDTSEEAFELCNIIDGSAEDAAFDGVKAKVGSLSKLLVVRKLGKKGAEWYTKEAAPFEHGCFHILKLTREQALSNVDEIASQLDSRDKVVAETLRKADFGGR